MAPSFGLKNQTQTINLKNNMGNQTKLTFLLSILDTSSFDEESLYDEVHPEDSGKKSCCCCGSKDVSSEDWKKLSEKDKKDRLEALSKLARPKQSCCSRLFGCGNGYKLKYLRDYGELM